MALNFLQQPSNRQVGQRTVTVQEGDIVHGGYFTFWKDHGIGFADEIFWPVRVDHLPDLNLAKYGGKLGNQDSDTGPAS